MNLTRRIDKLETATIARVQAERKAAIDALAVCRREFILSLNWPKSVSSELRKIA